MSALPDPIRPGEQDHVGRPLTQERACCTASWSAPSTPSGRSRTSHPWQYGQWSRSFPQRSRIPGVSGRTSRSPVASSTRRPVAVSPLERRGAGTRSRTERRRAPSRCAHSPPYRYHLGTAGGKERRRIDAIAGEEAVHVRGGRVARCAAVDHDDRPAGSGQDESRAEAGGAAADDQDVIIRLMAPTVAPRHRSAATIVAGSGTKECGLPVHGGRKPSLKGARRRGGKAQTFAAQRAFSRSSVLSEMTGISKSTLSRLETGQRRASLDCSCRLRGRTGCRSTTWSAPRRWATPGSGSTQACSTGERSFPSDASTRQRAGMENRRFRRRRSIPSSRGA